jgi:hypothetical protein
MKRKIKLLTLVIVACFSTNVAVAQSNTDEIIIEFFKIYEKSPTNAVDYIFGTNKWALERNKDAIENVKTQLNSSLKLVGDYYGKEKITEKSVGESLKLISYMLKFDRQPIRFTFTFYKPKDKWQILNFKFDDNLDDELEESGKVYRLKENLY